MLHNALLADFRGGEGAKKEPGTKYTRPRWVRGRCKEGASRAEEGPANKLGNRRGPWGVGGKEK